MLNDYVSAVLASLLLLLFGSSPPAGASPPLQAPTTNELIFDEEFDRLPSKFPNTEFLWKKRWIDQEQGVYVDPAYRGTASNALGINPFSVSHGILQIQASVPSPTVAPYLEGQKYLSGLLTTHSSFLQLYGYFEISAQIPAGKGFWPTFWLLPMGMMEHPPEIDILEARGDRPGILYLTAHYNIRSEPQMTTFKVSVADMTAGFHRYGVLWTKTYIAWYFDGERVAMTATPDDMHSPMYMLLNLAVGGKFPGQPDSSTTFPGNFLIDCVRVYSIKQEK